MKILRGSYFATVLVLVPALTKGIEFSAVFPNVKRVYLVRGYGFWQAIRSTCIDRDQAITVVFVTSQARKTASGVQLQQAPLSK